MALTSDVQQMQLGCHVISMPTFADNALSLSGDTPREYLLKIPRAEIDYYSNTTSVDGIKSLDFMSRNKNLILYGRNGAGKSHMAMNR